MDIGALIGDIVKAPFICIGWIIIGAIAGAVARQITGSKDAPFLADLILGIIGGFVGGIVVSLLGFYKPETGLTAFLINIVVAIIGATLLIGIGRLVSGQRRAPLA